MRLALQAIGETVLVPGNWHPCEPIALRGMVKAIREMDQELAALRKDNERLEAALLKAIGSGSK